MALRDWPYPRVLAHRCGGTLAPENTLAGLNLSAGLGCGGVEFDVMLNAESTPFVIHDETLERTSDGSGTVAGSSDAQLLALDAGSWFSERFAGEPMPRFAPLARRCRALGLVANVEIKPATGHEVETGRRVAADAAQLWAGAALPPLLSSFSEVALAAAAEVAPMLPRGLLVEDLPRDWLSRCRELGVVSLHADAACFDVAAIADIRAAGLWVVLYTVNDPAEAQRFLSLGVECIITDRPDIVTAS